MIASKTRQTIAMTMLVFESLERFLVDNALVRSKWRLGYFWIGHEQDGGGIFGSLLLLSIVSARALRTRRFQRGLFPFGESSLTDVMCFLRKWLSTIAFGWIAAGTRE